MARGAAVVLRSLSGGLNVQAAPYELKREESPDCMNVRSDVVRGAIRKRNGYYDLASAGSFTTQPRKIAAYQDGSVGIAVGLGTALQTLSPGGSPSAAHSATTTKPWRWDWAVGRTQTAQGPVFLMSDTDKLYFNGSSFGTWTADTAGGNPDYLTAIPTGRIMCAHENRLFIGDYDDPANPVDGRSSIRFSEVGNFRQWMEDGYVAFEPYSGGRITALCSMGRYLLVFKRDGIWRVYDSDTGANEKITNEAGTVFRDSVVATDQGAFFLDPDRGVMWTDGANVKAVGEPVLTLTRGLALYDEATYNVSAAYWEGSYWLSIPDSSGQPALLLEYDLQDRVWWRHDCPTFDLTVMSFPGSGDGALQRDSLIGAMPSAVLDAHFNASGTSGRLAQIMRPGLFADQVSGMTPRPVPARWLSAPHDLDGNPHLRKRLAELRVDAAGAGEISLARDLSLTADPVGQLEFTSAAAPYGWGDPLNPGTWGGSDVPPGQIWGGVGQSVTQSRFHTLGTARTVQLQVATESTDRFELHSYAWFVGPRRRTD